MSTEDYHAMKNDGVAPAIVVSAAPTPVYYDPYRSPAPETPQVSQFSVPLCGIGNIGGCLYSYLCTQCAMGTARHALDGSDCMVTCFNINPVLLRWTTRSAYNIPGNAWEDCIAGVFCPCCTVNQVLQTTQQFGRPNGTVGPEHNYHMFHAISNDDFCGHCLYASFCLPCAIGTSLQQSMDMPFILGCFCANFCIARNLLRYHYRLKGDDCLEDCLAPYGLFAMTYCISPMIPCFACCTYPYFVSMVMLMTNEAQRRGNTGSYLSPSRTATNNNSDAVYPTVVSTTAPPVIVAATVVSPIATNADGHNPGYTPQERAYI